MNTVVEAHHLRVSYGRHVALNLEQFVLDRAEGIVGVFGPNGAGKSTFLRTVVGDIVRYEGRLSVPNRAVVSYLPDEPFLYPWLTVSQCVELFRNRYPDFRTPVFEDFLSGAQFSYSSRVQSLSKGMNERLHLALVMSRAPHLYVLDEPLAGVDPLTRDHLLELIQGLRYPEAPMLLSTHLINGVDSIFDQVVLFSEGRVLRHDSAAHLRELGEGDLERAYKLSMLGQE
ncbi:ATP-binding cassette domain-containing protein [Schaalia suimastitidis]|uniref:ATP-binding cassette domain-containing protein n=1 Tax=Schaalia suimastitidis TaxID=121163 RepID=UPI000A052885|nr:ABC transporter ATP-binding protein [Schaalia suimastitidis]